MNDIFKAQDAIIDLLNAMEIDTKELPRIMGVPLLTISTIDSNTVLIVNERKLDDSKIIINVGIEK